MHPVRIAYIKLINVLCLCYKKHMKRKFEVLKAKPKQDKKIHTILENKKESQVKSNQSILGMEVSRNTSKESTGDSLLRLARIGETLKIKAPADLSSRIDDYLYGEEE